MLDPACPDDDPGAAGQPLHLHARVGIGLLGGATPARVLWLAKITVRRSRPRVYADPAT